MNLDSMVAEAFGSDARIVEKVEMEKGASSRRYFRLSLRGSGAPSSAVLMVLPDDALGSDEVTGEAQVEELPFVNMQRHLADAGVPVPGIHLAAVDRGAVILEDLGTTTLNGLLAGMDPAQVGAWYLAAVELLAKMHGTMWPIPEGCQACERRFDFDLLRWELDHYREWGLEAVHGPLEGGVRTQLDAAFDDLAREIAALPLGFVHRDYQSRNLMVVGEAPSHRSYSVIDFQDGLTGPRVYDLVALLNDSYVDLPREVQKRIIDRYALKTRIPRSEVQYEFDLITVQRKLKDGGRFVFIDRVKGDPSFLPFVEKSFSRVAGVLWRLPGHQALKEALSAADPARFSKA